MGRSIRTDRFRLTRWDSMLVPGRVEGIELYDLETDPQENLNLAPDPEWRATVEELSRQLDRGWRGALPENPLP